MPDWLLPQLLHHDAALLGGAVLINAGFTFIGALALALLAARSAGSPRVAKWLLLSPWLRVLWEIARGATPDAYVLSEHAGTQGGLGSFQLGVGLQAPLVPTLQAQLGMQGGEHRYAYSVGDGVSHWLYRHWGATPLLIALAGSLGVSCVLLFARVRLYRDWQRRLERPAALLGSVRAGLRRVQLFGCDEPQVGAFTSGVLRPRIWLPASLAAEQRQAVLEHELGHVRDFDVLWFGVVGVLADLFWFLPGARLLERRLHERAEEAADAQAIARGVCPKRLARVILEQAAAVSLVGPVPRMAGSARRLERRLLALAARPPRRRWQIALRLCLAATLTASAFISVFGGYA